LRIEHHAQLELEKTRFLVLFHSYEILKNQRRLGPGDELIASRDERDQVSESVAVMRHHVHSECCVQVKRELRSVQGELSEMTKENTALKRKLECLKEEKNAALNHATESRRKLEQAHNTKKSLFFSKV
jgi:predicted RNase H-like nuclease (RuvC/YqgF family)